MAEAVTLPTRYEQRVALVQDVIKADTTFDEKTSLALAVRMLHALDAIPEAVR